MANKARPEELHALAIAERVLGIELIHTDSNGQVDLQSADPVGSLDGEVAIEVTTVTSQERIATLKRLRKTIEERASKIPGNLPPVVLKNCWIVLAPDTQPNVHKTVRLAEKHLALLEKHNVSRFDSLQIARRPQGGGSGAKELDGAYARLAQLGIQLASVVAGCEREVERDGSPHRHKAVFSLGSGGSASGSNESVGLLCQALAGRSDNLQKLHISGAKRRHLFVWVDDDTQFSIARPLARIEPEEGDGGQFGLPTVAPNLGPSVTDLWVVHSRSLRGWYWDSESWRSLEKPVTVRPEAD
jgi:hypothetical protein